MKTLRLTLAGAALAAALPSLAASASATTAPAGNDAVATQPAQPPMQVALATPKDSAQRATPRSLTDAPVRKYTIEQASPNKPYRLEHERWVHDEDHAY
jgi:hypothetical protein